MLPFSNNEGDFTISSSKKVNLKAYNYMTNYN